MVEYQLNRRRAIKAVKTLPEYLPYMLRNGDKVIIQKEGWYVVDLKDLSCTCRENDNESPSTACIHLFMAIVWLIHIKLNYNYLDLI